MALAGSPNVGKTTLFNALTGLNQHVGNWPGKTVELATGWCRTPRTLLRVVDLPGMYGLAGHSPEEAVARDFLLTGRADVVALVVEPAGPERHLFLALYLMEFVGPLVVVLNDTRGGGAWKADPCRLEDLLGVPVVAVSAVRRHGLERLIQTLEAAPGGRCRPPGRLGAELESAVRELARELGPPDGFSPRWDAFRLLAGDPQPAARLTPEERTRLLTRASRLRDRVGGEVQKQALASLFEAAARIHRAWLGPTPGTAAARLDPDRLLCHAWLVYPVVVVLGCLVLWLTLVGARPLSEVLQALLARLVRQVPALVGAGAPSGLIGALVDGLLAGVGTVVAVMLPTMAIFFLLLTVLEESGLVVRLAMAADRPLQVVGSQGRHCMVCLMALGCNVPGLYASRAMTGRPRLLALLTAGLVPCNGRLGVMLPLSAIFFGRAAVVVMLGLWALSLGCLLLASLLLSRVLPEGSDEGAVMELGPYRLPHLPTVLSWTIRRRVLHVLARAVAVAAPITLGIWLCGNLPWGADLQATWTARLVLALEPLGRALGLDGSTLVAVLFAIPAKEVVVGALALAGGMARSLGEAGVLPLHALVATWDAFRALKFLVFFNLSVPCAYTLLVMRRETGSTGLTLLGAAIPLIAGCLATWLVHLLGCRLGYG